MIWVPHPSEIEVQHDSGTSGESMGDVTDIDSKCRFWLAVAKCYTLIYVRGGFVNSNGDTGSATLAIRIDSPRQAPGAVGDISAAALPTPYDFTLHSLPGVGVGGKPVAFRVQPDEYPYFTLSKGGILVLEWTNPDSQYWAIEVGLTDTSQRR